MKKINYILFTAATLLLAACNSNSREVITVNNVSFTMVTVEGGTFIMGADSTMWGAKSDESPTHSVTVNTFAIGESEVTQELWTAVMGSNPSGFNDNPQFPVESVNWFECQEFITKLNELTGRTFRLPTEAEWEFAARGGNRTYGTIFCGSDSIEKVAWYEKNGNNHTNPVKQKQPNKLCLYDMSGNVWEWCNDWYGAYSAETATNPDGCKDGRTRVIRGGSWFDTPEQCRPTGRSKASPRGGGCIVGLRLAL